MRRVVASPSSQGTCWECRFNVHNSHPVLGIDQERLSHTSPSVPPGGTASCVSSSRQVHCQVWNLLRIINLDAWACVPDLDTSGCLVTPDFGHETDEDFIQTSASSRRSKSSREYQAEDSGNLCKNNAIKIYCHHVSVVNYWLQVTCLPFTAEKLKAHRNNCLLTVSSYLHYGCDTVVC